MEQERSRELQQKLTREAFVIQELGGHKVDVANYEQAIRLIGKSCGIPRSETEERLSLIHRNRRDLKRIEAEETVTERVYTDIGLDMCNWSGLETFSVIIGLFQASLTLERCGERQALYSMAKELAETQNILDWIRHTPADLELYPWSLTCSPNE